MLSYYVSTFWVPCCDVRYDFRIQSMFGSSLPPVVCMRAHKTCFLCLFAYSGIQDILCTQCCQFLWIVYFWLPLRYSVTFIYIPYLIMWMSLNSSMEGVTSGSGITYPLRNTGVHILSFSGIRLLNLLFSMFCYVYHYSSFCPFPSDYCIVCSLICGFWLPHWYLQTSFFVNGKIICFPANYLNGSFILIKIHSWSWGQYIFYIYLSVDILYGSSQRHLKNFAVLL